MPKTSKADKEKTHETLLAIAADQLRQDGYAGLNVTDVMQAAGMTHGGFYRHFRNREDMAASATKQAFAGFLTRLELDLVSCSAPVALGRFIDRYLSMEHLARVSTGCPVAALGGDALRCSEKERHELEDGTDRLISLLDSALAQAANPAAIKGSVLLGILSGTLNLARLQSNRAQQEDTLSAARQLLAATGAIPSSAQATET